MNSFSDKKLQNVHHSRLNGLKFIINYLSGIPVEGKKVADLSAGSGFVAGLWADAGAKVEAYDLYPEIFENQKLNCKKLDLNFDFQILSESFDFVLLMETIEHIPDQLHLFKEISRILKPKGKLIITKPNNSNFAGRMANLWTEGERSNMFLPNEKTIISHDGEREYLGRFFLLGIQKMRSLAALAGLNIISIAPNQISNSSFIFGFWIYPFLKLRSYLTYKKLAKKPEEDASTLLKQHQLNCNTTILFQKHLCVIFEKNRF